MNHAYTALPVTLAALALLLLVPGAGAQATEQPFTAASASSADVNSILIDDDHVYLGHSGGRLVVADRDDGQVSWQAQVPSPPTRNIFGIGQTDDLVIAGFAFQSPNNDFSDPIIAYHKADGAQAWLRTYDEPGCTLAPCARDALRVLGDGDAVYVGFTRGVVMRLDASDGSMVWSARLPQAGTAVERTANVGALAVDGDFVYVATNDNLGTSPSDPNNRLHKLDKDTGAILASASVHDATANIQDVTNGLHADGTALYAAIFNGRVARLDIDTTSFGTITALTVVSDPAGCTPTPCTPPPRTPVAITGDADNVYTSHLGGWLYSWSKTPTGTGTPVLPPVWQRTDGMPSPKQAATANSRSLDLSPDGQWLAQAFDAGRFAKTSVLEGPTVNVQAPNGDDYLNANSAHPLRWTMNDHHSTDGLLTNPYIVDVTFDLSPDGGATYPYRAARITERAFTFSQLNSQPLLSTLDLPEGDDYRLKVTVEDPDGFSAQDVSDRTFTIDKTAPTISLDKYPQPDSVVRTDRPRVSIAFSDNLAGVRLDTVRFYIDDDTPRVPQLITGTVAAFNWTSSQPMSQGFHSVRAVVTDRAGNVATAQWSFRVDTQAPETPVSVPGRNTFLPDVRPALELRYQEPVNLVWARFGLQGAPLASLPNVTAQVSQPDVYRLSYRVPASAPALVPGSSYVWHVFVRDATGNNATTTLPFGIDTLRPQLSILATSDTPGNGSVIGQTSAVLAVRATDDFAGLDDSRTRWLSNGIDRTNRIAIADGVVRLAVSDLATGSYRNEVQVQDRAGNRATFNWTFAVDAQAPAITVLLQAPGAQTAVKAGDALLAIVRVQDTQTVKTVEVDWGSLASNGTGYKAFPPATKVDGTLETRLTVKVGETASRTVQVRVRATDNLGNTAVLTRDVLVDNVAPTASLARLPQFSAPNFRLAWTGSDGFGAIDRYDVDVAVDGGAFQALAAGTHEAGLDFTTAVDVAYYQFRVFAIDGAGNRQVVAGPAAATTVIGDVFEHLVLPARIVRDQPTGVAAEVVSKVDYPIEDVRLRLRGLDAGLPTLNVSLEKVGRTYLSQVTLSAADVPTGRYLATFLARSPDGTQYESTPQVIEVSDIAGLALQGSDATKQKSPAVPFVAGLALVALAAALRRRWT